MTEKIKPNRVVVNDAVAIDQFPDLIEHEANNSQVSLDSHDLVLRSKPKEKKSKKDKLGEIQHAEKKNRLSAGFDKGIESILVMGFE
jgi:hypothetical protein